MRHAVVSLFELHLFFERECHGLSTHIEHVCYFLVSTVVLQAVQHIGEETHKSMDTDVHALPEAKFGGSFPELVDFIFVILEQKLVVNDQERMGGDISRERWESCDAWHCDREIVV